MRGTLLVMTVTLLALILSPSLAAAATDYAEYNARYVVCPY